MRRGLSCIFIYLCLAFLSLLWDEWQAYRYHLVGDSLDWMFGALKVCFALFCAYRAIRLVFSKRFALAAIYGLFLTAMVLIRIFSHEVECAMMWGRAAFFTVNPGLCRSEARGDGHIVICYGYHYSLGWGFVGSEKLLVLDRSDMLGVVSDNWPEVIKKRLIGNGAANALNVEGCEFEGAAQLAWHMYWIWGKC